MACRDSHGVGWIVTVLTELTPTTVFKIVEHGRVRVSKGIVVGLPYVVKMAHTLGCLKISGNTRRVRRNPGWICSPPGLTISIRPDWISHVLLMFPPNITTGMTPFQSWNWGCNNVSLITDEVRLGLTSLFTILSVTIASYNSTWSPDGGNGQQVDQLSRMRRNPWGTHKIIAHLWWSITPSDHKLRCKTNHHNFAVVHSPDIIQWYGP